MAEDNRQETPESRIGRLEERTKAQDDRIKMLEKHEEEHREIMTSIHEMTLSMRDFANAQATTQKWIEKQEAEKDLITNMRMQFQEHSSKLTTVDDRLKSIEEEKTDKSRSVWKFFVGGVVAALIPIILKAVFGW